MKPHFYKEYQILNCANITEDYEDLPEIKLNFTQNGTFIFDNHKTNEIVNLGIHTEDLIVFQVENIKL